MTIRLILSCLTSFMISVCVGMIIFYPASAFPDINSGNYGFKMSTNVVSWLASFVGLFALPGSLITAPIMDRWGRKFALIIITLPMAIGWLLVVASFNVLTLGVGRAVLGLSVGMQYSVLVVYLSEISPKQMRGLFASMFGICVYIGGLLINCMAIVMNWRWMAVVGLASVTIASLASLCMYETPRWLIGKGHRAAAATVIGAVWNIDEPQLIQREINDIETNLKLLSKYNFIQGLRQLLKPPLWKPLLITQLLMVFQQFTGNAFINNYTVTIFKETMTNTHLTDPILQNPKYQTCLISLGYCVGSVIATFFIDHLGRRFLLISSGSLISVCLMAFGCYDYFQIVDVTIADRYLYWLPLLCLLGYVLGFGFAYGSVPFILVAEMFPMQVRGVANSLGAFNHNLCYFIVVKVFPNVKSVPDFGIIWIYGGVAIVSVLFVVFFVPETKGRSLEEIQTLWTAKSVNYKTDVPTQIAQNTRF